MQLTIYNLNDLMWKCMVECEWKDIKLGNKIIIIIIIIITN